MKVYIRNNNSEYDYPDEMEKILGYLSEHGRIFVSGKTIEKLYRHFCEDIYDTGWMVTDDVVLANFERWLSELGI